MKQWPSLDTLYAEALVAYHSGYFREAGRKYQEILELDFNQAEAWRGLGIVYYKQEQYEDALDAIYQSLEIDSSRSLAHYSLGLVLAKIGYFSQAIQAYQTAIEINPDWIEAYNNLGNTLAESGELERAEAVFRQAIALHPNSSSYLNSGNILLARQLLDEAIAAYQTALQLKPRDPDIIANLGIAFQAKNDSALACFYFGYAAYRQHNYADALDYFNQFKATQSIDIDFYLAVADCYQCLNQLETAIETYREAIALYPNSPELYRSFVQALQNFGRIEDAIQLAQKASLLFPENLSLKLEKQRLLPIIYNNPEEINFYRNRFIRELDELIQQTSLETPEAKQNALLAIGSGTNFYLPYQGKNDLELQKKYGQFAHQVMAANYPQWVKFLPILPRASHFCTQTEETSPPDPLPETGRGGNFSPFPNREGGWGVRFFKSEMLPMLPLSETGKIRIGYISSSLQWHTIGLVFLGWLRNYNRQQFEVYCYYIGQEEDLLTQLYQLSVDSFHHIPNNLEAVCEKILGDRLHVLVFLDIGIYAPMTQIASLRLAPIQCAAWGHPITSGLPTIDYYISGDLMEPENADLHYSERLIRLPNIGICYAKPAIPEPSKTRSDFGLRDEAVVYLSCQSLFKYLPQYDNIYAAIAREVPQAQFVFVSHPHATITDKFRQRLQRAFAKEGLKSEEYCTILPRQGKRDYWNLNLVSDIFLDTLDFTGFLTTLEAVACNLPIVTRAGEFMRSRQSSGILQMLGVTDTIAQTEAEYIKIAVKLGLDREWREATRSRIQERQHLLYSDRTCVEALEAFYQRVVP